MAYRKDFNVFVATNTGILKGVKINDGKNIIKYIQKLDVLTKEHEITSMAWGDQEEKEVLIGLANQTVKIYDSEFNAFTRNMDAKCGEGPIIGITRYNGTILTAASSGHVKLWTSGSEDILNTGGHLERMRHSPYNRDVVATGGKSNDLKLWNIGAGYENVFKAKNVPHNHLQLEVPVWVSDMAFLPDSGKIAVCTRYGQVRVYDPSAQKRPVLNLDVHESALTCIAASPKQGHVVVGSGTGHMFLVDLRYKGLKCGHYKGITGSVREIVCHKSEPYVISVSRDRHLRVHHSDTRKLLYSEYMKSQLNCVLMRSDFNPKGPKPEPVITKKVNKKDSCAQLSEDEDDMNKIFNSMETVGEVEEVEGVKEVVKKRKIIITGLDSPKKKRKPRT